MSNTKKTKTKSVARKDVEKAELREKILETAREMVLQKGFGELSIRRLADAIGYAPGTIYLYFKDRDELTREICVRGFVGLFEAMRSAADVVDPRARLVALSQAYANFAVNNSETYRLSFMEDPKFTAEMFRAAPLESENGAGRQAFGYIVKALEDMKSSGQITSDADSTLLAEMLWCGIHGVVSLKLIYPAIPGNSTETLVDTMIQTLLDGLK